MSDHDDWLRLSQRQLECLASFASGPSRSWAWGSGTIASLRKAGMISKERDALTGVVYRITDAGRAALAGGK